MPKRLRSREAIRSRLRRGEAWAHHVDWDLFFVCVQFLCGNDLRRLQSFGFTQREAWHVLHKNTPSQFVFNRLCGAMHLKPDQLRKDHK